MSWVVGTGGGSVILAQHHHRRQRQGFHQVDPGSFQGKQYASMRSCRGLGWWGSVLRLRAREAEAGRRGGGGGEDDAPSASRSTISASPGSVLASSEASSIRVTVKNADGHPVSGATVRLEASGDGNSLTQPGWGYRFRRSGHRILPFQRCRHQDDPCYGQRFRPDQPNGDGRGPHSASGAHPSIFPGAALRYRKGQENFAHCPGRRSR